jgi:hypothetical protein
MFHSYRGLFGAASVPTGSASTMTRVPSGSMAPGGGAISMPGAVSMPGGGLSSGGTLSMPAGGLSSGGTLSIPSASLSSPGLVATPGVAQASVASNTGVTTSALTPTSPQGAFTQQVLNPYTRSLAGTGLVTMAAPHCHPGQRGFVLGDDMQDSVALEAMLDQIAENVSTEFAPLGAEEVEEFGLVKKSCGCPAEKFGEDGWSHSQGQQPPVFKDSFKVGAGLALGVFAVAAGAVAVSKAIKK